MIQLARQNPMAASMPRQKHHGPPAELAGQKLIGWFAERSRDGHPPFLLQTFHRIQPAPAYDPNFHDGILTGGGGDCPAAVAGGGVSQSGGPRSVVAAPSKGRDRARPSKLKIS